MGKSGKKGNETSENLASPESRHWENNLSSGSSFGRWFLVTFVGAEWGLEVGKGRKSAKTVT